MQQLLKRSGYTSQQTAEEQVHDRRGGQAFFLESRSSLATASSLAAIMKSFSVSPPRECVHSSTLSRFQFCAAAPCLT